MKQVNARIKIVNFLEQNIIYIVKEFIFGLIDPFHVTSQQAGLENDKIYISQTETESY